MGLLPFPSPQWHRSLSQDGEKILPLFIRKGWGPRDLSSEKAQVGGFRALDGEGAEEGTYSGSCLLSKEAWGSQLKPLIDSSGSRDKADDVNDVPQAPHGHHPTRPLFL